MPDPPGPPDRGRPQERGAPAPPRRRLTAARKLLLALFGVFLAAGLLALFEGILRIARYGPDLRAFRIEESLGRREVVFNRQVCLRYFPPEIAKLPGFERFAAQKAPGTYRVFSLGASSTVGDPYGPPASYSAFLEAMLQDLHPERTVEVINCGIVAISSTNVLDLLSEVLRQEPDLILLYTGHNEAYGADAVLSGLRGTVDTRAGLKLRLRLRNTRLGRLAQELARKARGAADGGRRDFGMDLMEGKVLPEWSGLHRSMLRIYRGNLDEMLRLCRRRGVDAILCTLPSNLRDQSPLGSEHGPGLRAEARGTWERALREGREAMERARWEEARARLAEAAAAEPRHAETRFRLARCLDRLGRPAEAAPEYQAARDLDAVHFRACAGQNEVVREVAARFRDGVLLVDVERRLAEASPDRLPGREFFTEHVHPVIRGHDAIARWICEAMAADPIGARLGSWDLSRLRTHEEYRARLGLTSIDDAAGLLLTLKHKLSKWPFTNACENAEAAAWMRREIDSLKAGFDPPAASVFADLEAGRFPDGFDYGHRHQEVARRALAGGDALGAIREFALAARHFGPNAEICVNQAQAALLAGRFAPAESLLDAAASLDPGLPRTVFVRGMLRASQGQGAEARQLFQQYLQKESTGRFAQAARQSIQRLDRGLPVGVERNRTAAGGSP